MSVFEIKTSDPAPSWSGFDYYCPEIDPHLKLTSTEMGWWPEGQYYKTLQISELVVDSNYVRAYQAVWRNGNLVEWVFSNHRKSHFSVKENHVIFRWYSLESNFLILRKICSLGDPQTEHVSSLITGFSLTDEHEKTHEVEVGEWKYKSALFLYWLAEWKDTFIMDDKRRQLVWNYFGHDICSDAMENQNTKHTTVRYLLNQWGSKVTITRPWSQKKSDEAKATN